MPHGASLSMRAAAEIGLDYPHFGQSVKLKFEMAMQAEMSSDATTLLRHLNAVMPCICPDFQSFPFAGHGTAFIIHCQRLRASRADPG